MTEVWPPPADDSTVWRQVVVLDSSSASGGSRVPLRPVRLWGREVLIDGEHRVFCDYCRELVPVDVLGRPGNGHHVSVVGAVPSGTLLPQFDEDET